MWFVASQGECFSIKSLFSVGICIKCSLSVELSGTPGTEKLVACASLRSLFFGPAEGASGGASAEGASLYN